MSDNDPEYKDWYANCDHMPGPGQDGDLRVGGKVRCTTSGWSVELRPTVGNTGTSQLMLQLDLVVTPPPRDAPVLKAIEYVPVEYHDESPIEYDEVKFNRADADPPPTMKVDHIERPPES